MKTRSGKTKPEKRKRLPRKGNVRHAKTSADLIGWDGALRNPARSVPH